MTSSDKQCIIKRSWSPLLEVLHELGLEKHCIEAGALAMTVFHRLGIVDAYRLTVRVEIGNDAHLQYIRAYGVPKDQAGIDAHDAAGGAISQVGYGNAGPDVWDGHLVVIVPDGYNGKNAMIDLTIPQADWPEVGISLPPACYGVGSDFLAGTRAAVYNVNSCQVRYRAFPDDHGYNQWGDRIDLPDFENAVQDVLSRVKR